MSVDETQGGRRRPVRLLLGLLLLAVLAGALVVLGPGLLGRLEECLRRAGHPQARRAYSLGS